MYNVRHQTPSPSPSYRSSPPPYCPFNNSYSSQNGSQLVHYHSPQASSSSQTSSAVSGYGVNHAQQVALQHQVRGQNVLVTVNNKEVELSEASVNAFCNDFVCRILAGCSTLNSLLLDKLAKEHKINIRFHEIKSGKIIKRKYASSAPNAALSAGLVAALGDFSQFSTLVETFFTYTYTDETEHTDSYSTHYYANDQYTITGCYLRRKVYKETNALKVALMSSKYTDTRYQTACYLFTFRVAQAAKFMENYLYGTH